MWCKQDYSYREIADSFSRILEFLDKVIEKKGDYFLENTTIIELVKLFCGCSFNASGEDAEKFINFKKAFRYANLRQEAFDVQNALRQHLSYKGLHSEAVKVLESMVDKFGYKTSLTISELLLNGRCELEKDPEKAIFYLEEFLDGWRYDEEKGGNYDFPLVLDYSLDRRLCTRVKDYFENIPSDSKNALTFFKCALKILEISEEFECYEEVHDWYGRFVNENFEKLIDFGKKAKKANSTYFLKQLLSFCFVHLTRSPEMEKEVIFLCLLPLSDEEIFEDWVTWGSEICEIDDQEAFDQLVKVIYVNLEKRFQANPELTDYLFSMISESPEKIESKEDLLLPRDSKWYLLPMKGNQEVFDDFEIDTSFESNVKVDTYKIETKQQEKKSWPVIPLKENWNFPDVRSSERNTLFLSNDFLIVFMVRPLTLGSSSIEPHETYIQHLYAITAYSRVNESTRVDPDSPICCYSIEKATLPMAVPMLCGYFSSGRHASFGSYKEEINDDVTALQVLTDKVLKMLEITEELTIGEEPVFPEVADGSVQRKKRKTDSICKLLRAKLKQIS